MSSFLQLYEDFLQKKENDTIRQNLTLPPDEEEEHITQIESPTKCSGGEATPTQIVACEKNKMEHVYNRDGGRPSSELTGLAPARTVVVHRPPQCALCYPHPLDEHELSNGNEVEIPPYNEINAKEAMSECHRIAKYVKNNNPDDVNWEERISQYGWSHIQKTVFSKVVRILDNDQLGRLSYVNRQHEPMQRRVLVDKSASRLRKVFASISWDPRLTQWLHCLLMDALPSTYMASYLDILQTLKTKVPSLMDKMLFARPLNISQELLAPVMKKPWKPVITKQPNKLTQNIVFVTLPAIPTGGPMPRRLKLWHEQLATISQVVDIQLPAITGQILRQPLEHIAEQLVSLARVRVQELRSENPMRSIILVGFNAGAALAIQVAMSEQVASVICMGFAYNTFNGVRGNPDDRLLDIKIPILFVIGQNSSRSSTEEIESLREKMQSETSFIIVGSADDMLRVSKNHRKNENVTQSMIDHMILDEITDFIRKILTTPPGPRIPTTASSLYLSKLGKNIQNTENTSTRSPAPRKRKIDNDGQNSQNSDQLPNKSKYITNMGRPRTRPVVDISNTANNTTKTNQQTIIPASQKVQTKTLQISPNPFSNDDLNMAIQTILNDEQETSNEITKIFPPKQVTNFELVAQSSSTPIKTALINHANLQKQTLYPSNTTGGTSTPIASKIKLIPPNQFVQLKPTAMPTQSKVYTFKTTGGTSTAGGLTTANLTGIVRQNQQQQQHQQSHQQQIFTLKSPSGQTTQFVTGAPPMTQQRYTVVKSSNIGTTIQLSASTSSSSSTTTATATTKNIVIGGGGGNIIATSSAATTSNTIGGGGSMDLSNIIDMPIVFADNDGNLTDSMEPTSSTSASSTATTTNTDSSSSSGVFKSVAEITAKKLLTTTPSISKSNFGQLIISQKIIKEANAATNAVTATNSTARATSLYTLNNGNTIKTNSPIISGGIQQQLTTNSTQLTGQTNVKNKFVFINRNTMKACPGIVAAARTTTASLPKYAKVVVAAKPTTTTISNAITTTPNIKQLSVQQIQPINVLTKSLPAVQIIGSTSANTLTTTSSGGIEQKIPIRNIVVQPGGLKQIPPHLKTQLLNRNLTVRKLVNIVPVQKNISAVLQQNSSTASSAAAVTAITTATTTASSTIIGNTSNSNSPASLQSSPKIITLNPINRSTPPTTDKHD